MAERDYQARLQIYCRPRMRNAIRAVASLEGKSLTDLFEELMLDKIRQYPEIYQIVHEEEPE